MQPHVENMASQADLQLSSSSGLSSELNSNDPNSLLTRGRTRSPNRNVPSLAVVPSAGVARANSTPARASTSDSANSTVTSQSPIPSLPPHVVPRPLLQAFNAQASDARTYTTFNLQAVDARAVNVGATLQEVSQVADAAATQAAAATASEAERRHHEQVRSLMTEVGAQVERDRNALVAQAEVQRQALQQQVGELSEVVRSQAAVIEQMRAQFEPLCSNAEAQRLEAERLRQELARARQTLDERERLRPSSSNAAGFPVSSPAPTPCAAENAPGASLLQQTEAGKTHDTHAFSRNHGVRIPAAIATERVSTEMSMVLQAISVLQDQVQALTSATPKASPVRLAKSSSQSSSSAKSVGKDSLSSSSDDSKSPAEHVDGRCTAQGKDPYEHEKRTMRTKQYDKLKLTIFPKSAADIRPFRNHLFSVVTQFCKGSEAELHQWLRDIEQLSASDLGQATSFPVLDRILAAKLIEQAKGTQFLLEFQALQEKALRKGFQPKGRVLLHTVIKRFKLQKDRGMTLTQQHLLSLKLGGHAPKDLENFRDRVEYVLGALEEDETPSQSALRSFLYEQLKKVPLLQLQIDKFRSASASSHRKSFTWLFRKLNEAIDEAQHDINQASITASLSAKVSGAPAKPDKPDKPQKPQKPDKQAKGGKPDATEPSSSSTAAPIVPESKAKTKPKAKAKAKPQDSQQQKPAREMTKEEKARTPCLFFPTGTCFRTNCPFSHDANALHPNPKTAPKPKAKAKVAAGACAVLSLGALPEAQASSARDNCSAENAPDVSKVGSAHNCAAETAPDVSKVGSARNCAAETAPDVSKVGSARNCAAATAPDVTKVGSVRSCAAETAPDASKLKRVGYSSLCGYVRSSVASKMLTFMTAAVHLAQPALPGVISGFTSAVPCSPQFVTNADGTATISWLGDTGAGRYIGSLQDVSSVPAFRESVSASDQPVTFATGGGDRPATDSVRVQGSIMNNDEVYLLEGSPWAMSVGDLVNNKGKAFLWVPDGTGKAKPFLVEDLKSLKLTCPKDKRRYADELHENVPIFKETVRISHMPAAG